MRAALLCLLAGCGFHTDGASRGRHPLPDLHWLGGGDTVELLADAGAGNVDGATAPGATTELDAGGGGSELEPDGGGAAVGAGEGDAAPPELDAGSDAGTPPATAEDFVGTWQGRRLRLPCDAEVTAQLVQGCSDPCSGSLTVSPGLEWIEGNFLPDSSWPLWRPVVLSGGQLHATAAGATVDWSLRLWLDGDDLLGAERLDPDGPQQPTCFAIWAVRP